MPLPPYLNYKNAADGPTSLTLTLRQDSLVIDTIVFTRIPLSQILPDIAAGIYTGYTGLCVSEDAILEAVQFGESAGSPAGEHRNFVMVTSPTANIRNQGAVQYGAAFGFVPMDECCRRGWLMGFSSSVYREIDPDADPDSGDEYTIVLTLNARCDVLNKSQQSVATVAPDMSGEESIDAEVDVEVLQAGDSTHNAQQKVTINSPYWDLAGSMDPGPPITFKSEIILENTKLKVTVKFHNVTTPHPPTITYESKIEDVDYTSFIEVTNVIDGVIIGFVNEAGYQAIDQLSITAGSGAVKVWPKKYVTQTPTVKVQTNGWTPDPELFEVPMADGLRADLSGFVEKEIEVEGVPVIYRVEIA